ncbi:hypothetical protein A0O28_0052160 [Trichoderma guizhouense]|uniref:Uncharacterized protein n=1 Tax=Trichoderma guizhouense TaxID=1491466 RepID=A0A1T3CEI8_9HYPO|nr:hypothetical protein A0O28_0052160 [Trichoderma guizhouense]
MLHRLHPTDLTIDDTYSYFAGAPLPALPLRTDPGHQCHLQSPDSYLSSPGTVGPELLRFSGPFFYWSITTPPPL